MWNSQRRQICADNTEDQLPSGEDSSGMMGLGKNQTLEILAQPCGLNKNLRIVYLKQVNSMACKLYLNKAVRKEKDSAQPAPTPGGSQFTEKAKERAKQKGNTKGGAQKGPSLPLLAITATEDRPSGPSPRFLGFQSLLGKHRSARPLQP